MKLGQSMHISDLLTHVDMKDLDLVTRSRNWGYFLFHEIKCVTMYILVNEKYQSVRFDLVHRSNEQAGIR